MINNKIYDLANTLQNLNVKGAKFNYAMAKNLDALKAEVTALEAGLKHSEGFAAYEKKRIEILEEGAVIDEATGKPVIENNSYKLKDRTKTLADLDVLFKKNKKFIDEYNKQVTDHNGLLEQENTSFKPYKVKPEDLPEELTTQEINSIFDLIEE